MENYEKCKHVQSVGTYAVYVDPGCPEAHKIKGVIERNMDYGNLGSDSERNCR